MVKKEFVDASSFSFFYYAYLTALLAMYAAVTMINPATILVPPGSNAGLLLAIRLTATHVAAIPTTPMVSVIIRTALRIRIFLLCAFIPAISTPPLIFLFQSCTFNQALQFLKSYTLRVSSYLAQLHGFA